MMMCLTISLMFLLMTVDVDGQQYWGVNYNPSYVCALRGSSVRLSCIYPPGYQITSVYWTKPVYFTGAEEPNLCLNINDRGKIVCDSDYINAYSITLTDVTELDKNIYYCRFTVTGHSGVWTGSPGVQLDVTDLQVETQQRVKEKDSVTLTCKTTCNLTKGTTFIWYKNNQILTEDTVNQFHLQSVSRDDSGVYRCDAVRGHERLSSPDVYLTVGNVDGQQYWGVNYNPSYVCALRGSSVRLFCALIYPRVYKVTTSFWTKTPYKPTPDVCVDTNYRDRIQCLNTNTKTLNIAFTRVTEADKNSYYCRFITNKPDGKWTEVPGVQLDVTDLQVETQQRVKEKDSVTLTCKTTCRLTEETTFIWYKNNQRLTEDTVNQFHLQSVSRDDSGVYRCDAVRGHERLSSPDVYLNVEYGPENVTASISGSSGVIMEDDSVNLICSSESNPPVHNYSWFKENKTSSVGSGKIYIISNISSDHSGEYKCKARNEHGVRNSTAVILNVLYGPKNVTASISGSSGVIMEDDSVNLTCSSESNPPVHNYSWFKENKTSSVGSGQTFSITNINSSLSGWFYCVAQNEHGSQRSDAVSVTVTERLSSDLYTVSAVVAGCVLFFIIVLVFIILLIRKRRRDDGSDVNRQNQDNRFRRSAGDASANDVPVYALVSTNQSTASESADVNEVQYASVQHFRNKEMMNEYVENDCHDRSDDHRSADVIYSSVK